MGGEAWLGGLAAAALVITAAVVALLLTYRRAPGAQVEVTLDNLTRNLMPALTSAAAELAQLRQGFSYLDQAQRDLAKLVADLGQRLELTAAGLADRTAQAQLTLQKEIAEAHRLVEAVRTELAERKERDKEVGRAVAHLEAVLAGSPGKGAAGENILEEAFSGFPPDMVERGFRVRGKVVEYALVLAGTGKRLPIDSKWPATGELERLLSETDPGERRRTVTEIQAAVRRKIREVAQYIDPLVTTDQAIAAVPDAVSPYCGELSYEAYRQGVILMPYSLIVPYVLNLFSLHLKYAQSVDMTVLGDALSSIERSVDALDKVLENSVQRGATMVANAYDEARRLSDRIRSTVLTIRALPPVAGRQALTAEASPAGAEASPAGAEASPAGAQVGSPPTERADDPAAGLHLDNSATTR